MAYERIMGLYVNDDEVYQKYRETMEPILNKMGGSFGFDFKISEVLRSKTHKHINRVFTIAFPSEKMMEDFFAREDYQNIKEQYLDKAVSDKVVIAMLENDE
jgi:uncharacterized protein (DUF1330 family)